MRLDLRLVIPAAVAWLTAGLAVALPGIPVAVVVAAWLIAVVLVIVQRRWFVIAGVSIAALALVLSMVALRAPSRHPEVLFEVGPRSVALDLVTTQTVVPGAEYFAATATAVTVGDDTSVIDVPVIVFTTPGERIGIGATISFD